MPRLNSGWWPTSSKLDDVPGVVPSAVVPPGTTRSVATTRTEGIRRRDIAPPFDRPEARERAHPWVFERDDRWDCPSEGLVRPCAVAHGERFFALFFAFFASSTRALSAPSIR